MRRQGLCCFASFFWRGGGGLSFLGLMVFGMLVVLLTAQEGFAKDR